jgi:hypothetical protein
MNWIKCPPLIHKLLVSRKVTKGAFQFDHGATLCIICSDYSHSASLMLIHTSSPHVCSSLSRINRAQLEVFSLHQNRGQLRLPHVVPYHNPFLSRFIQTISRMSAVLLVPAAARFEVPVPLFGQCAAPGSKTEQHPRQRGLRPQGMCPLLLMYSDRFKETRMQTRVPYFWAGYFMKHCFTVWKMAFQTFEYFGLRATKVVTASVFSSIFDD